MEIIAVEHFGVEQEEGLVIYTTDGHILLCPFGEGDDVRRAVLPTLYEMRDLPAEQGLALLLALWMSTDPVAHFAAASYYSHGLVKEIQYRRALGPSSRGVAGIEGPVFYSNPLWGRPDIDKVFLEGARMEKATALPFAINMDRAGLLRRLPRGPFA